VIGPDVRIGRGTVIGPNVVIGPGVAIGRDCLISANVFVGFALIGDRVRLAAGAVIGEAGFGVAGSAEGSLDVPQLGRVILQDGVSVGANSCIDRGAYDDTVVGENTKIDNLVQIAHNVVLGRNCVLAAHTGISGSARIGDGVMFGGAVGLADHVSVGDGARLAARAGAAWDVPAGETWGGYPAKPFRQWMRETAWLTKNARSRGEGEKE
jgi:UDP-3-O-[3-hydroxymyristoyl] glucosamine N-acyltransferase